MLTAPRPPSERTAPFRGTKVALKTERRFLFLMDKPKNQSRRCSRAPHIRRAAREGALRIAAGAPRPGETCDHPAHRPKPCWSISLRGYPRGAATEGGEGVGDGTNGRVRGSASPIPDPPSSPPSRRQCPRTPRAGRVPIAATCPRRPSAGPRRPSGPHLIRRCGRGAGGPDSSTTTGRSASGRGGSGPPAVCAGRAPAALRASRARAPRPPPARPALPGAPRGSCPPRPSAPGGPERGVGPAPRTALPGVRRPRGSDEGGEGWTPGAEKLVGRAGGGRGQKSLHRKEPPTAGSHSRGRKPQGSELGRPQCPRTCPLLHPPGRGTALCRLAAGGSPPVIPSWQASDEWSQGARSWDARSRLTILFSWGVGVGGWDPGGGPGLQGMPSTHT